MVDDPLRCVIRLRSMLQSQDRSSVVITDQGAVMAAIGTELRGSDVYIHYLVCHHHPQLLLQMPTTSTNQPVQLAILTGSCHTA